MSTPASPPTAPETRMTPARTISDTDFYKENGYGYDYCLVFSIMEQTEEATQFQKEWSMQKICQRLVNAGLEIKMFYSSNKHSKDPKEERMVFCKIRADLDRLKQEADRIDYKLRLDPHTLRQKVEDGWPARPAHKSETDPHQYLIQPATIEDIKGASKRSPYDNIYGKYEQDGPGAGGVHEKSEAEGGVDEMLYYSWGKSATGNRQIFRSVDRIKLIMSILEAPLAVSGCKIDFDKLKRPNGPRSKPKEAAIKANYPLHDDRERGALQEEWMNPWALPNNQPLEGIKNYFGEKVALYFGWLGHYTTWLAAPAFVGFVIQILVWKAGNPDVPGLAVFGVFMCLWSTFFLEYWKRRQSTFAMEWGMTGFEAEEDERPAFEGEEIRSPITGSLIKWFNPLAKLRKLLYSAVVISSLILLVGGIIAGIFIFKSTTKRNCTMIWGIEAHKLGGALNALQIQIMNMIYQTIAENLNDMENHRTDTQYEDNLITKVFLFQFVNSYASFFYISFIKEPFMDERCLGSNQHGIQKCGNTTAPVDPSEVPPIGFRWDVDKNDQAQYDNEGKIKFEPDPACMEELHTALLIIFVTRLVVGNVQEVVIPYVLAKVKARNEAKERRQEAAKMALNDTPNSSTHIKTTGTENLSEAEKQLNLADYQKGSGKDGTFEDYAEMIIQFGYASLFVVAFPLAPLLALMNNYVEIRVDAFKLLQLSKRAEPKGAEDIGTWYNILEIMATAAVVTNTLLVVFTAKSMFGDSRTQEKWVAFVLIEHAVLLIKFGFALAVEDVPEQVQMQLARQEFLVLKTIEHVADDDDELHIKKGKLKMDIFDRDDDAVVTGDAEAGFGVTALAHAGPTAGLAGTRADI